MIRFFSPARARALAAGVALAATAAALPSRLGAIEITLPTETARLKESPLPGYAQAAAFCSICHSTDYVTIQPPTLTRANWVAAVTKMQKVFGAPIPAASIDPIAEYLARTYGSEQPPPTASTKLSSARPARTTS